MLASVLGVFHARFSKLYRGWLLVMLFTNPVFLVFGFSVLLARTRPIPAVLTASAYILMPFCGQILQAAVDEFDFAQARAARSLGASPVFVVFHHILPFVRQQILASLLLSALYAFGFFLTPVFVGLGRVVTLGTVIYGVTNAVGDWTGACQLCIVAIGAQIVLTALWLLAAKFLVGFRVRI
jgi:ABC-type spermidine/putrescine transport system permease subunit I